MGRAKRVRPGRLWLAFETRRWRAVEPLLRRAARAALAHGGQPGLSVALVVVGEARLCELHSRFLDDPTATDVISFDLRGPERLSEGGPQVEIYVSIERAREVARARGLPLRHELALYVVHGCLHLCGYDDRAPRARARMRRAEQHVLASLGLKHDTREHEFGDESARR